ncbi:GNAT family N-acetyltransferase [Streptomyces sp. B6B3]|uniref:GNAT family N-acetyltransferase n=1 Tax=Streptomyces sp. B6B3 TaxID=3153570 RepID=UPI00325D3BC6
MTDQPRRDVDHRPAPRRLSSYLLRPATPDDVDGARSVMLDTFYREFGYGYAPAWHADVVDIEGAYLRHPDHLLLVAVHDDHVVATTAVHTRGPAHPPHPKWLAERYGSASTAQLLRVYVRPGHRRNGLARALVGMAGEFAAARGRDRLYLHTNVRVPEAEPFWSSVARQVFDARTTGEHGPGVATVHYEIPLPR